MPTWLQLMIDSFWPLLRAGLLFTVPLTLITFVGGIALGFVLALVPPLLIGHFAGMQGHQPVGGLI